MKKALTLITLCTLMFGCGKKQTSYSLESDEKDNAANLRLDIAVELAIREAEENSQREEQQRVKQQEREQKERERRRSYGRAAYSMLTSGWNRYEKLSLQEQGVGTRQILAIGLYLRYEDTVVWNIKATNDPRPEDTSQSKGQEWSMDEMVRLKKGLEKYMQWAEVAKREGMRDISREIDKSLGLSFMVDASGEPKLVLRWFEVFDWDVFKETAPRLDSQTVISLDTFVDRLISKSNEFNKNVELLIQEEARRNALLDESLK